MELTSMSAAAADTWFTISNFIAILGGVLAVIGTGGIFLSGGIREHYAELKQSELRAQTAEAQRDAAKANERAAELNKDSEALKVELERERSERLRLEQRVAPREVTPAMRKRLGELVRPDADTKLYVKVALNNGEGDVFINQFAMACVAAGWPQDRIEGSTCAGASFPPGVTIGVHKDEASLGCVRPIARALATVLSEAGLAAEHALSIDDVPFGTVSIVAGYKKLQYA